MAANVHGRGLTLRPFVNDVESLTLIGADGERRTCSRSENAELFRLICGGYGLFGFVDTVTLRLAPRHKVRRTVEIETADRLIARFDERIADGYAFGDFQFALDPSSPDFLRRGIFSCYKPVSNDTPIPEQQRALSPNDWKQLLWLAHFDKQRAWDAYAAHYSVRDGQVYWSDTHQLSTYIDDYHSWLDRETNTAASGDRDHQRAVRPAHRAGRVPGRSGGRLPRQRRRLYLRDHPADRARRRELPHVGEAAVRMHDLQPAYAPHERRESSTRRRHSGA